MPTPADWYPDPEDPTGLRYWDGAGWTEHRTPAVAPPTPFESPAPQPPTPPADVFPSSEQPHAGAHRAPDPGQEPLAGSYTPTPSQPYDTHPTTPYEPPSYESPSYEPPSWDAPPTQSHEAASFVPPPGQPGGPSGEGPNKKLVIGIIAGAAAILLAIVLVIAFVVIGKNEPATTASQATSSESATSSSETTTSETATESSETEAPLPPPTGAQGSDGDYSFSVASTETGDTITSTVSDSVETAADGMYYVVHLNVSNTGTSPLTFVATFQQLSAAGQTFPLDDTATAFLGGTVADIAPGSQVETPLVYDVPVGTEPDSILLRADPASPGVELPLQ
ncbi:MAG: DUF4352 domain-containing protein [Mycobacterium sp.]